MTSEEKYIKDLVKYYCSRYNLKVEVLEIKKVDHEYIVVIKEVRYERKN